MRDLDLVLYLSNVIKIITLFTRTCAREKCKYKGKKYGLLTKFARSRWLDIGQVLFWEFRDRDEVEVHKLAKKERGQYPAILTEQTWSIKDLLYGFRGNSPVSNSP